MDSNNPLETIMKILNMVLKNMSDSTANPPRDTSIIDELDKNGFSAEDIAMAMRCLDLIANQKSTASSASTSTDDKAERHTNGIRHLHAIEAIRLTHDAQQMLLNLLEVGQITPLHFEKTIEYLWRNDLRDVGPSRLHLILSLNEPNPGASDFPFISDRIPKPNFIN